MATPEFVRRWSRDRRVRRVALGAGGLGVAMILLAGVLWTRCGFTGCPDPATLVVYMPGGAPTVLDRHGAHLVELHPLRGEVHSLDVMPDHLAQAFIAVEDRRFYSHGGVDWVRVGGAAVGDVLRGGRPQGASTLTMQLARSVFPDRIPRADRSLRRKFVEARVARRIEGTYEKDRVLELYLNHVYLGVATPGVGAASRHFFNRPPSELTLEQSAMLAGLARAPASYDPRRNPDQAQVRRNLVLSLMEDQGRITPEEAEVARAALLGVSPERPVPSSATPAPYFVDLVRDELEDVLGAGAFVAGLRVHTTLDPTTQEAAEDALSGRLQEIEAGRFGTYGGPAFDPYASGGQEGTDYLQGAVVVMDVENGDILALVGGRNHSHSRFNRAVSGQRPVGSAFKPFVYAAALQHGFAASQPILDRPFRLTAEGSAAWTPRNYDGGLRGRVGMRESLVHSLNIPTARLGLAVGIPRVVETARQAGITSPIEATPSVTLGTVPLSPLELTTAYAGLAGLGSRPTPRLLLKVENQAGEVLHTSAAERQEGLDPRVAWMVTRMLQDVVSRGTGTGARSGGIRGPVAGKTGTTQDATDVWFAGYTPQWAATVWIGFDRPQPVLRRATGGQLAAPVWGRTMASLQGDGDAPAEWERPSGIVSRTVDMATGFVLTEDCLYRPPDLAQEFFLAEYVPGEACPEAEGLLNRFAGVIRGLFSRGSQQPPPAPESDLSDAEENTIQELQGRTPSGPEGVGAFLGAPLVPTARR